MATHKKFFMYAIWVIVFFIFSQIIIYVTLNTTYKNITIELKKDIFKEVEAKATSINGYVKYKIDESIETEIKDKYIKVETYSKNGTQMGSKYIKVNDTTKDKDGKEELRFNFNRVDKIELDIVDEIPLNVTEEQKHSDPRLKGVMLISALVLLITLG